MGVAALKLAGVVNKNGRGRKIFRARFARGLFSTLLEILDTPLSLTNPPVEQSRSEVCQCLTRPGQGNTYFSLGNFIIFMSVGHLENIPHACHYVAIV